VVISGTALLETYTLSFTISGSPRQWNVTVKTPRGMTTECETQELLPYGLFDEMLADALAASKEERRQRARP
jgi:hypothetical protein